MVKGPAVKFPGLEDFGVAESLLFPPALAWYMGVVFGAVLPAADRGRCQTPPTHPRGPTTPHGLAGSSGFGGRGLACSLVVMAAETNPGARLLLLVVVVVGGLVTFSPLRGAGSCGGVPV